MEAGSTKKHFVDFDNYTNPTPSQEDIGWGRAISVGFFAWILSIALLIVTRIIVGLIHSYYLENLLRRTAMSSEGLWIASIIIGICAIIPGLGYVSQTRNFNKATFIAATIAGWLLYICVFTFYYL